MTWGPCFTEAEAQGWLARTLADSAQDYLTACRSRVQHDTQPWQTFRDDLVTLSRVDMEAHGNRVVTGLILAKLLASGVIDEIDIRGCLSD